MTHRQAVALMVLATFCWSLAGVVTRHLDAARSFEVTFWRSFFTAVVLAVALTAIRGPALWRDLLRARWQLWFSGFCWGLMFTSFMVALTMTTVANVLVMSAFGPLLTAVFARVFLNHRLPPRTWFAIAIGGLGIVWMFGQEAGDGMSFIGTLIATLVPVAASANWTVLQFIGHRTSDADRAAAPDMLPAAMIGGAISAAVTLPLAWPFQASVHDLGLLTFLAVVQLAIPSMMIVAVSRALPAAEIALLALLEVVFGISLVWVGAGERPPTATMIGGGMVVAALIANEALALYQRRR